MPNSSTGKWAKILSIFFICLVMCIFTVSNCHSGSYCCECEFLCFSFDAENPSGADQKCTEYIISSGLNVACFIEMHEGNYVCSPGPFGIERCSYGANIDICPTETLYGEYSEQVEILRYFRDSVLSKSQEGRELIKFYYLWSPAIVKAMEEDKEFKEWVKETIDSALPMIEREMK